MTTAPVIAFVTGSVLPPPELYLLQHQLFLRLVCRRASLIVEASPCDLSVHRCPAATNAASNFSAVFCSGGVMQVTILICFTLLPYLCLQASLLLFLGVSPSCSNWLSWSLSDVNGQLSVFPCADCCSAVCLKGNLVGCFVG